MFDMAEFAKRNLIEGFHNGSFSKQRVNILAMNYLDMGKISQNDLEEIMKAMEPPEEPEK